MPEKPLVVLTPADFEQIYQTTLARPRPVTPAFIEAEKVRCKADPVYFINRYCKIYDNDTSGWIPFALWPFQADAVRDASALAPDGVSPLYPRIIILKARQEGYTWLLGVAHKLWKMMFRSITEVLVFSQAEDDATAVISEQRMRGMYRELPDWLKMPISVSSVHEFRLDNNSGVRALPAARGGDSRTVTDVVVDEADLIDDLDDLISRAEPTLGEKGQLIVIGRAVKKKPNSSFKRRYRAAKAAMLSGEDALWNKVVFAPWYWRTTGRTNFISRLVEVPTTTHIKLAQPTLGDFGKIAPSPNASYPSRILNTRTGDIRVVMGIGEAGIVETAPALDQWQAGDQIISMAWKDRLDRETLAVSFTLDPVHEQHPHTDTEALSAASLDKRYAPETIAILSRDWRPISPPGAPMIPGLRLYAAPAKGRRYGIGMDPSGGKSDGDDAGLQIIDAETLEQVATLQIKVEPTQFANYGHELSVYYFNAPILFEFNNHGGALYAQLKERGAVLAMGESRKGQKERTPGWYTTERSKNTLYDTGAKAFESVIEETRSLDGELRSEVSRPIIFDSQTAIQLASIDKNDLRAPAGEHDDLAVAYVLAVKCVYRGGSSMERVLHRLWDEPASVPVGGPGWRPMWPAPVPGVIDVAARHVTVPELPAGVGTDWRVKREGESTEDWAARLRFGGR